MNKILNMIPLLFVITINSTNIQAVSALELLKHINTTTPRDTLKEFINNMGQYKKSIEQNKPEKADLYIHRAIQTFELNSDSSLLKTANLTKKAVLLKEVLDRIFNYNYAKITNSSEVKIYYLLDTTIKLKQMPAGNNREFEYLFTSSSLKNINKIYNSIKQLPYKKHSTKGALYNDSTWLSFALTKLVKGETLGMLNWKWLGIVLSLFLGFLMKKLSLVMLAIFKRISQKTKTEWDDNLINSIEKPVSMIVAILVWFLCLKLLNINNNIDLILETLLQLGFSMTLIWLFLNLANLSTAFLLDQSTKNRFPLDAQIIPLIGKSLRIFILLFGVLITIQNLGVNIMSVIAGLGLGGLAFALAAKDTAANLFGSLMLLSDKPAKVGDWIKTKEHEGTVTEIGFRSTRIKTFYDSEISVPNSLLANAVIDNMGKRELRRIKTEIGLTYDSSPAKIKQLIKEIEALIEAHPKSSKNNKHVVFNKFDASSLNILLYFFIQVKDWKEELLVKQELFLDIMTITENLGLSFAFPSQSLYIEKGLPIEKLRT